MYVPKGNNQFHFFVRFKYPLKLFLQIWTCEGIFWGIQSSWDWNCCICVSSSLCASSRCYRLWAVCRSASRCHRLRESEDGVTDCERPSQSLWVRIDRPSTKSPHNSDFNMRYIKTWTELNLYTPTHVWLPHTITLHMYTFHHIFTHTYPTIHQIIPSLPPYPWE